MNSKVRTQFRNPALAWILLTAATAPAWATNDSASWGGDNVADLGTTITATSFNSSNVGFTGNPALTNNAWGMQGAFTNFYLPTSALTVTIDARSSVLNYPAFSIFRSDGPFAGETVAVDTPLEVTGQIHNFNSVGQAALPSDPSSIGIRWAVGPNGLVETLGYASSSANNYTNGYGGAVNSGAHDISTDNLYETGVTGSIGTVGNPAFATSKRFADLILNDLQAGWYSLFVGGSDISAAGAAITVKVTASAQASSYNPTAVPVPAAAWLFGSALAGLIGLGRKKQHI